MSPHLRHAIDSIRARSALVDRLFGPDQNNGIGTGAWHPSTPEARWSCERDGHLFARQFGDPAYCVECGIDEDDAA